MGEPRVPLGLVAIGAGGRSQAMLTCFLLACFLLPSAQLSETLSKFLSAQVTVETDRDRGPGDSHQQARDTVGDKEDKASLLGCGANHSHKQES